MNADVAHPRPCSLAPPCPGAVCLRATALMPPQRLIIHQPVAVSPVPVLRASATDAHLYSRCATKASPAQALADTGAELWDDDGPSSFKGGAVSE